jgi:hypothetical protein
VSIKFEFRLLSLGATTLSITTFILMTFSTKGLYVTHSIMGSHVTLSIKGLGVTFSINDNRHNNTATMLNVAFHIFLC